MSIVPFSVGFRGVDFIKLDYVTPGSPDAGQDLDPDQSNLVVCYHRAIQNSGRQMRLDISWKPEYENDSYYQKWAEKYVSPSA